MQEHSKLATGDRQYYIALGEFLTCKAPTIIESVPSQPNGNFINVYSLVNHSFNTRYFARDYDLRKFPPFSDPLLFYNHAIGRWEGESCIVFMRGWLTADWINHIGAGHDVDPEFWARHLDFRPADVNSNRFSVPSQSSTSCHLMELPFITIGTRRTQKGETSLKKIAQMRVRVADALKKHHHQLSKLVSSGMSVGDSRIRDFHVLDETYFAAEQKISICMQTDHGELNSFRRKYYPIYPSLLTFTDKFLKSSFGSTQAAILRMEFRTRKRSQRHG